MTCAALRSRHILLGTSLALSLLLARAGSAAPGVEVAQPRLAAQAGMVSVRFDLPEGAATAYLPDDIADGDVFSGTFDAPRGFVLTHERQLARAGRAFTWRVPAETTSGFVLVLSDGQGKERGHVALRTARGGPSEAAFHLPALLQAGQPFPVRGSFDGRSATTRVTIGGRRAVTIVESPRRAIVRAPIEVLGATRGEVRESSRGLASNVSSISVGIGAPDAADGVTREVTLQGLAGVRQDIPLEIGGESFYVKADEILPDGTFSVRRAFRGSVPDLTATLLIPQSRRDEVAIILRTPLRQAGRTLQTQRAEALRALDYDALPVTAELLQDFLLAGDAALTMLAVDEPRALPLILSGIPDSGRNIELLALDWFIGRPAGVRAAAAAEAHAAALRVLRRILSTTTAELAIYVIGLTGNEADFPLLERFHESGRIGSLGLRDASEAALVRLGSRTHLEHLRSELVPPVSAASTYDEGLGLARALRKAAFAGDRALLPDVCGHVADRPIVDIDIKVEPGLVAQNALSAIVDGTPVPDPSLRRSQDQWAAFCRGVTR